MVFHFRCVGGGGDFTDKDTIKYASETDWEGGI